MRAREALDQITEDVGLLYAFQALQAERLAVLCGAGLSMAGPSFLPSANELAIAAKQAYDAAREPGTTALPATIDEQADLFFRDGHLADIYLRKLIDPHAFSGPPNGGHTAIADLLLTRGIQTAVTTNVDRMIEAAGDFLFGRIGAGVDRATVSALLPTEAPLLKIHGCWSTARDSTVWAPSQVTASPTAERLAACAEWLKIRLLDRDLLIIGYFTDWDYLNEVLAIALGEVRPAKVIVVDPSDGAWLASKAPALQALGQRVGSPFYHVNASGSTFLERLRLQFSKTYVRRVLAEGAQAFQSAYSTTPTASWSEPATSDNDILWLIRRDLQGCLPGQPASLLEPPSEPTLGLTIIELLARGATADGNYWLVGGERVRVLRTANQLLHLIEARFAREHAPLGAPDVVIAVGAEPATLLPDIVRGRATGTIVRGSAPRWLTRAEALVEFAP